LSVEKVIDHWLGPGEKDGESIPLSLQENGIHPKARSESRFYGEWWYFDARLEDGHVIVGFLQASELMSRRPGVELHIYCPDGNKLSVVKKYPLSELKASEDKCDVRVGDNRCYVDCSDGKSLPRHYLFIEEEGFLADLVFESVLPGWKPGKGLTEYGNRGYFSWIVPVPRAKVTGKIRYGDNEISTRGIGYHDHNVVTADMRRILSHWYWGRIFATDFTLLYAYVVTSKKFGCHVSKPLMLAFRDRVVLSTGEMRLKEGELLFDKKANRTYPSWLEVEVPGRLFLSLKVMRIVDCNDLLSGINPIIMNPAVRWLVNRFVRPGWFRFESEYNLRVFHEGRNYEEKGTTLHEMVALK